MKPNNPTKYYSVIDTMNVLCVGRTTLYAIIAVGALSTVKVGARRMVPAESIAAFQENLKDQAFQAKLNHQLRQAKLNRQFAA